MADPVITAEALLPHRSPADARVRRERLCGAEEFPVVERSTYLSICEGTTLSRRVRRAVDEFLDVTCASSALRARATSSPA
jgi:hypothetical protein